MIGIAAIIPLAVAMFALIDPGPRMPFIMRLTEMLTIIAIVYTIRYLGTCFLFFSERAKNVILRFIVKFRVSAIARENIFDGANVKKRNNKLNDINSTRAPEAPAKQNEKNFFFNPMLMS